MPKLVIADEIYQQYPTLRIGMVVAAGIRVRKQDPELEQLKRLVEARVKRQGFTTSTLMQHPFIAFWRSMHQKLGIEMEQNAAPVEAMIRQVLEGGQIPHFNTAVDVYLTTASAHFLPIGGCDLQKVEGDIVLRISPGNEPFVPFEGESSVGAKPKNRTEPGEIVYSDDLRVLARSWNWWHCKETSITTETTHLALFVNAPEWIIPTGTLESVVGELEETLQGYCGGQTKSLVVAASDKLTYDILASDRIL